jgi:CreA protein
MVLDMTWPNRNGSLRNRVKGMIGWRNAVIIGLVAAWLSPAVAIADEVGRIGVDWVGNDIIVEAVEDPKVAGVTCHVSYFERSLIDRLQKGNWFEDPSNSSIDCRQTGPITIGDINLDEDGEEIFKNRRSLIWKVLVVNRIYDKEHNTLIYLAHSQQVQEGSAKMSISTVPLYQGDGSVLTPPNL